MLEDRAWVAPKRGGSGLLVGFGVGSLALHGLALFVLHTRPVERPAVQRPVELRPVVRRFWIPYAVPPSIASRSSPLYSPQRPW